MSFNPRKYRREFLGAMGLYAVTVVGAVYLAKALQPSGPLLLAIALAPTGPALLATFVAFRHFATLDEMYKRLHVESFAASALIVALSSFSIWLLEGAAPFRISMIWVLPAIVGGWGVIVCLRQFLLSRL